MGTVGLGSGMGPHWAGDTGLAAVALGWLL